MLNYTEHEAKEKKIPFRKINVEKVVPPKELKQTWTFIYSFTFSTHLLTYSEHLTDLCCLCSALHRGEKDKWDTQEVRPGILVFGWIWRCYSTVVMMQILAFGNLHSTDLGLKSCSPAYQLLPLERYLISLHLSFPVSHVGKIVSDMKKLL